MELFENGPLVVRRYERAKSKALAARLVEMVHIAQGGDEILEFDRPADDVRDGVPPSFDSADKHLSLLACSLSKIVG